MGSPKFRNVSVQNQPAEFFRPTYSFARSEWIFDDTAQNFLLKFWKIYIYSFENQSQSEINS